MTPFPLAAPDGRVYAYACGVCHHVHGGPTRLVRLDGPDERIVASSLENAEACCRCSERPCGAPLEEGRFYRLSGRCARCEGIAGCGDLVWSMAHMGHGVCEHCGGERAECDCFVEDCKTCGRPRFRCECGQTR